MRAVGPSFGFVSDKSWDEPEVNIMHSVNTQQSCRWISQRIGASWCTPAYAAARKAAINLRGRARETHLVVGVLAQLFLVALARRLPDPAQHRFPVQISLRHPRSRRPHGQPSFG